MLKTVAALGVACLAAFVVAPASTPTPLVPSGVTVAGLPAGGLTAEPLRSRLEAALARPLTIDDGTTQTLIDPATLGAQADVDDGRRLRLHEHAGEFACPSRSPTPAPRC